MAKFVSRWNLLGVLQEGGPLPGPETGLLSNTRKQIVWGDICADKARDFIGKGHSGGEQEVKGTQENGSATWLAVLGFMVMALVSGLSLANQLTQSPSWWCMPCSAKMDAREEDSGRWSDMWCLLLTFPELFRLVVAYSVILTRTSCRKTTHANGYSGAWPGWAVSVSVLPLTGALAVSAFPFWIFFFFPLLPPYRKINW